MIILPRIAVSACLTAACLAVSGLSFASPTLLSVSASIGSTMASGSSKSSEKAPKVTEGDYQAIAIAQADAEHPGRTQLTLVAANNDPTTVFHLYVPQEEMRRGNVRVGDVVRAQKRAYGLAFARQGEAKPFTLVLDDSWSGEFRPRLVS